MITEKRNIFGYEVADLLIKVSSKEEYLKDICDGKIYMNESGYFRKLEDNYRGDKFDGKCPINLSEIKKASLVLANSQKPENRIEIPVETITEFVMGFSGDDKIPLFCSTQVDENILIKITDTQWRFKEEFTSEMEQFGEYYLLFYKIELQNGLDELAHDIGANWVADKVVYKNILETYDINLMNKDTSSYDYLESFFIKDNMYRWQNEWRIVLHRDQPIIGKMEDHYEANIKPLTLYHIGKVEDLRNIIMGVSEDEK